MSLRMRHGPPCSSRRSRSPAPCHPGGNGRARTFFGDDDWDVIADFAGLLASAPEQDLFDSLRAAESIGRPLGSDRFLTRIERLTGRVLKPGKRGPKPSEPDRGR
jgi:hypothetical protein